MLKDPEVVEDDEDLGPPVIEPPVEELIEEFSYRIRPTHNHKHMLELFAAYVYENEKYMKKKNRSAGKRARKHLLEIFHLCRARRREIQDGINSLAPFEWR